MSVEIETPRSHIAPSNEITALLDSTQSTVQCHKYTDIKHSSISYASSVDIVPFYKRPIFHIKMTLVTILLILFILAAVYYNHIFHIFVNFMNWINVHPIQGIFAYLLFCWIWLVCMLPETALTIGGGFVFTQTYGNIGIAISIILVFVGSQLGATHAFLQGRYLMRSCIKRIANRYTQFKVIDKIVEQNGAKIAFLLRLTIFTPYNVMNYFMGITSISLKDYVLGNFGMLPDCIMMCFLGSFLSSIVEIEDIKQSLSKSQKKTMLIFSIIGTIFAVLVAVYVGVLAKKQFQKIGKQIQIEKQDIA